MIKFLKMLWDTVLFSINICFQAYGGFLLIEAWKFEIVYIYDVSIGIDMTPIEPFEFAALFLFVVQMGLYASIQHRYEKWLGKIAAWTRRK